MPLSGLHAAEADLILIRMDLSCGEVVSLGHGDLTPALGFRHARESQECCDSIDITVRNIRIVM